ncbi:S41 family peptidase [Sphingomonas koreensis]
MRNSALAAALLAAVPHAAFAQTGVQSEPAPLSAEARAHSFDVLIRRLDHYVDPAKRPAIVAALRGARERLLAMPSEAGFLVETSKLLVSVSGDKHLTLFRKGPLPPAADRPETNFGIARAVIDQDGIGHLVLDGFSNHPDSRAAIDKAMADIAGARALIIDLRANGGGGEVSFRRLLGHLFPTATELTAIEWRQCAPPSAGRPDACTQVAPRRERRFTDQPASPAFPERPVYVLVSRASFSAAEALAFELQAHRRALVIGERTPGGGNPAVGMDLESELIVIMPIGRMVPTRGRAWEGRGVIPDIDVPALEAPATALALARRKPR